MRRIAGMIFLAGIVTASPIAAQEHVSTLVFPVVARTAGSGGSQWVSDLTVNNLLDEPVAVGIAFFPENQANSFDPSFPNRFQLEARETRVIEDVLAERFGYDSNIKGVLLVSVDSDMISGNSEEANIAAVTRTYNAADPAGTYGQSVPAIEAYGATTAPLIATGARNDASYRSNFGVVSLAFSQRIDFHYRVLGADGAVLAEGSKSVPRLSVRQWSFQQLGVGAVEGAMTVEVRLDEGSLSPDPCEEPANIIMAYVSKVDNGTGDAEFIYAFQTEGFPCED